MPVPIDTYGKALAAYARAASGASPAESRSPAGSTSFADMLKGVVSEAVQSGSAAEKASVAAVGGSGDLNKVVTAVAEAEVTLQTVVAVRERVIDAYKEILRMPM